GRAAYDQRRPVLELDLNLTAEQALDECRRRGLVVRSERELAGRAGSHHWHLRIPGRRGTLELNEWESRVWVKVHPLRDGGWATGGGCSSAKRVRTSRTSGTGVRSPRSCSPSRLMCSAGLRSRASSSSRPFTSASTGWASSTSASSWVRRSTSSRECIGPC